ncbi:MAG: hypothetical protein F2667_08615 [Actinobacteria bacterium]|uniref:Unannotated protein n=1 Tax=freshwater metagenome TaxID=449393 RepID=A0A6J6QZM6_9ZZZZ|nr:hypothetical protein [Actinomycetota bacterium]
MPSENPFDLTPHDGNAHDAWSTAFERLSPERRIALWYGAVEVEKPAVLADRLAISDVAARALVASSVTAFGRAVVEAADSGLAAPGRELAAVMADGAASTLRAAQRREVREWIAAVVLGADGGAHLATLSRGVRSAPLVEAVRQPSVTSRPRRGAALLAGAAVIAAVTAVATGVVDLGSDTAPAAAAGTPVVGPTELSEESPAAPAPAAEPGTESGLEPVLAPERTPIVLAPVAVPAAPTAPDPSSDPSSSPSPGPSSGGGGQGTPSGPGTEPEPEPEPEPGPVGVTVDQGTGQVRVVLALPGLDPIVVETPPIFAG